MQSKNFNLQMHSSRSERPKGEEHLFSGYLRLEECN